MRARCNKQSNSGYANYGGRGIKVCERWEKFENFLADMGQPGEGETLDRIDVNGNYEPGNCRWASHKTQSRNRRNTKMVTIWGIERPLSEWCERARAEYVLTYSRIFVQGMNPAIALGWEWAA